jgi:hypothetical protein
MTVLRADVWHVKPGRLDSVIAITKAGQDFIKRFGGQNHHLAQMSVGSQDTSRYLSIIEWDGYEAYGKQFVDASASDSEWQA